MAFRKAALDLIELVAFRQLGADHLCHIDLNIGGHAINRQPCATLPYFLERLTLYVSARLIAS